MYNTQSYIKDLTKAYKAEATAKQKLDLQTMITIRCLTAFIIVATKTNLYKNKKAMTKYITANCFGIEDLTNSPEKSAIYNKFNAAAFVIESTPSLTQGVDTDEELSRRLDIAFEVYTSQGQILAARKAAKAKDSAPSAGAGADTQPGGFENNELVPTEQPADALTTLKELAPQFAELIESAALIDAGEAESAVAVVAAAIAKLVDKRVKKVAQQIPLMEERCPCPDYQPKKESGRGRGTISIYFVFAFKIPLVEETRNPEILECDFI